MTRAVRCGDLPGWADYVATMTQSGENSRCLEAWRLAADLCIPVEFNTVDVSILAYSAWYFCWVQLDGRELRQAEQMERRRGLKVVSGGAS